MFSTVRGGESKSLHFLLEVSGRREPVASITVITDVRVRSRTLRPHLNRALLAKLISSRVSRSFC